MGPLRKKDKKKIWYKWVCPTCKTEKKTSSSVLSLHCSMCFTKMEKDNLREN